MESANMRQNANWHHPGWQCRMASHAWRGRAVMDTGDGSFRIEVWDWDEKPHLRRLDVSLGALGEWQMLRPGARLLTSCRRAADLSDTTVKVACPVRSRGRFSARDATRVARTTRNTLITSKLGALPNGWPDRFLPDQWSSGHQQPHSIRHLRSSIWKRRFCGRALFPR